MLLNPFFFLFTIFAFANKYKTNQKFQRHTNVSMMCTITFDWCTRAHMNRKMPFDLIEYQISLHMFQPLQSKRLTPIFIDELRYMVVLGALVFMFALNPTSFSHLKAKWLGKKGKQKKNLADFHSTDDQRCSKTCQLAWRIVRTLCIPREK